MKLFSFKLDRLLFLFILLVVNQAFINAQQIEFIAKAPQIVVTGEEFRLTYVVNAEGANFEGPTSIHNFEIVSGPILSESSSFSIQNGDSVRSFSQFYTYIIKSDYPSVYTLPSASIEVNGKTYTSNTLNTKIVLTEPYTYNSNIEKIKEFDLAINTVGESFTNYIIITILFFIIGLGCLIIGFTQKKKSFKISGFIILGMSVFYILYFLLLKSLLESLASFVLNA